METRVARCHCGHMEVRCEGAPRRISMCYCEQCQRRTGSSFSVAVFYARDKVELQRGETRQYERPSASGFAVAFHFCPACGANVFWEPRRMPELIGVALGAFADPLLGPPEQAVWLAEKQVWLTVPEGIAAFAENPERWRS